MGIMMEKRRTRPRTVSGVTLKSLSLGLLTMQFSGLILMLHYSRVMPAPDGRRYLPSTAIFLVELLRLTICVTVALYELAVKAPRSASATGLLEALGTAVFAGDSWKVALPASLYTLSNSLQYVGISNLDAATFHVTYQFRIIVTALLSVFMLGRVLNGKQWFSLVLLMVGVAIVSLPHDDSPSLPSSHHSRIYVPRSANFLREHLTKVKAERYLTRRSATYEGIQADEELQNPLTDTSVGLLAVFAVCILSGWAGVYFEKIIKTSHTNVSLMTRNVQMSTYSLFPAFFIGVLFLDGEEIAKYGFFAGYNWVVVVSIVIQSFGGIISSFCVCYADNISKNFAISISMVLSSLASVFFFNFTADLRFIAGSTVVLAATYLYTMQETQQPPLEIRFSEGADRIRALDTKHEMDLAIPIPKTPLIKEEVAMSTSRPSSPTHKKRKNESGYFASIHD